MVQIRRLKPLVKLAIPTKPVMHGPPRPDPPSKRRSTYQRQERRLRDYPAPTPQDTPCVLWQGPVDRYGYGALKRTVDGVVKSYKAHRWVMEEVLGRRLEPSEVVLHACDNPPCFAVAHLSIGTIQDNNRDMLEKGRASPPPVNVFYGPDNWNTKITPEQAEEITVAYMSKRLSVKELAVIYGVSGSTIYNVVKPARRAASDERQRQRRAGGSH